MAQLKPCGWCPLQQATPWIVYGVFSGPSVLEGKEVKKRLSRRQISHIRRLCFQRLIRPCEEPTTGHPTAVPALESLPYRWEPHLATDEEAISPPPLRDGSHPGARVKSIKKQIANVLHTGAIRTILFPSLLAKPITGEQVWIKKEC